MTPASIHSGEGVRRPPTGLTIMPAASGAPGATAAAAAWWTPAARGTGRYGRWACCCGRTRATRRSCCRCARALLTAVAHTDEELLQVPYSVGGASPVQVLVALIGSSHTNDAGRDFAVLAMGAYCNTIQVQHLSRCGPALSLSAQLASRVSRLISRARRAGGAGHGPAPRGGRGEGAGGPPGAGERHSNCTTAHSNYTAPHS